MTVSRFSYQQNCLAGTTGFVLNVGSYDDPAYLKSMAKDRVFNCDINAWDGVDYIMDCREEWPFPDNFAELVIMGDILEHLFPPEALRALSEAHRVSLKLCLTVPEDSRHEGNGYGTDSVGAKSHCYTWTEDRIIVLLQDTGWQIVDWQEVDYNFVPRGFFILSQRLPAGMNGSES